jgi:predicted dehydrogenase
VIIATPDHWHARISIDALNAGKHVYCEKPMVHAIEEGAGIIEAQTNSGKVFQVGSQYRSSLMYLKARELYQQNAIGKLNMVEAWLDRNTAMGAWEYTVPPDANPTTCDWDRFLGSAPKRPFDAVRFFRWRNFIDYGTGVAGDLFVHLLTGLHTVTGSLGPNRVYATGGLRYWTHDRDVPDVMLATMDYPESDAHPAFNLILRVNFKSSLADESFGVRFVGSDGAMTASFTDLTLSKTPREDEMDYSISSFAEKTQKEIEAAWHTSHPPAGIDTIKPEDKQVFATANNPHLDHHRNFYKSIREGQPMIEDATFGLRAAAPALLNNESYFKKKICHWDPVKLTVTG